MRSMSNKLWGENVEYFYRNRSSWIPMPVLAPWTLSMFPDRLHGTAMYCNHDFPWLLEHYRRMMSKLRGKYRCRTIMECHPLWQYSDRIKIFQNPDITWYFPMSGSFPYGHEYCCCSCYCCCCFWFVSMHEVIELLTSLKNQSSTCTNTNTRTCTRCDIIYIRSSAINQCPVYGPSKLSCPWRPCPDNFRRTGRSKQQEEECDRNYDNCHCGPVQMTRLSKRDEVSPNSVNSPC